MKEKLLYHWYNLKGTFWFVPLAVILGSIIITDILLYIDSIYVIKVPVFLEFFFNGSVASARSVLATIAGSMVGVAGTVFSITLVALTMASGQFGPRLLQSFMYDRLNQVVLGTYIANFICSLITLRAINVTKTYNFIPNITITTLIIIAILNIFLLIIYIHHISVSIQADSVINKISERINKKINTTFPNKDESTEENLHLDSSISEYLRDYPYETVIHSDEEGYIETINSNVLINCTQENDFIIFLKNRPGDFIVKEMPLLSIASKGEMDDSIQQKLKSAFLFGNKRSSMNNLVFEIEQITEVALRALSPGINDPNTGMNSIDKILSALCKIVKTNYNSAYILDDDENPRVFVKPLTLNTILDVTLSPIRFYGRDNIDILLKLMRSYAYLYTVVTCDEERKTIKEHAKRVYRSGLKNIEEKDEFAYLEEEYQSRFGSWVN